MHPHPHPITGILRRSPPLSPPSPPTHTIPACPPCTLAPQRDAAKEEALAKLTALAKKREETLTHDGALRERALAIEVERLEAELKSVQEFKERQVRGRAGDSGWVGVTRVHLTDLVCKPRVNA